MKMRKSFFQHTLKFYIIKTNFYCSGYYKIKNQKSKIKIEESQQVGINFLFLPCFLAFLLP